MMLATIREDTWNMQHIISKSKRWNFSDIPGGSGAIKDLKDLPTWFKVATTLEKDPNPHPEATCPISHQSA